MNRFSRIGRLVERAARADSLGVLAACDAAASTPLLQGMAAATRTQALPPAAAALPSLQHWRSYASQQRARGAPEGSYAAPPSNARPMNIRVTMVSSNLLAEPYKGEPPRLPLSSWVTPSGWKERWRRWLSGAKSVYTISKCKRYITGWTLPTFKTEALTAYQQACAALAAGDLTALRQVTTPAVFSDMKRQIKQRQAGGWARVEWSLLQPPTLGEIEVVHGRLIAIDPKDDSTGFAQLTVRFKSAQAFAAFDRRGRLVAGAPEQGVQVDDCWVFERALKAQVASRWRVAGRLSLPGQEGGSTGTAQLEASPTAAIVGAG